MKSNKVSLPDSVHHRIRKEFYSGKINFNINIIYLYTSESADSLVFIIANRQLSYIYLLYNLEGELVWYQYQYHKKIIKPTNSDAILREHGITEEDLLGDEYGRRNSKWNEKKLITVMW